MITPEQLAEWKRIEQEASPGRWIWLGKDRNFLHFTGGYGDMGDFVISMSKKGATPTPQNAAFIAESRTAMPALIAEVERLRKIEEAALEWHAIRTEKLSADLDGLDVVVSVYAIEEAERKLDAIMTEEESE